jgi:hypothetical protein
MALWKQGSVMSEKEKTEAREKMDLVKIVRAYIITMVDCVSGYKALLVDSETMRVCSTLIGRTELADHNVVLIEQTDDVDLKDHKELKVSFDSSSHKI